MATEAQKKAIHRYEEYTVDRVNVRLPKGYKDRIIASGQTVNAFIVEAVRQRLLPLPEPVPVLDPDSDSSAGAGAGDLQSAPPVQDSDPDS